MFKAMIIAPDAETRARLKSVADASDLLPNSICVRGLSSALDEMMFHASIDLILISSDFPNEEVLTFLDQAKATSVGRKANYVLIVKGNEQRSNELINSMMAGIHAFLHEPFTAASLEETALLATKVNGATSRARLKLATGILFTEIMEQAGSEQQEQGLPERMQACSNRLEEATGTTLQVYLDNFAEILAAMSPTKRVSKTGTGFRMALRKTLQQLIS